MNKKEIKNDIYNSMNILIDEGSKIKDELLNKEKDELWNNDIINKIKPIDGDTFTDGSTKIRILGIDTPETVDGKNKNEILKGLNNVDEIKKKEDEIFKEYVPAKIEPHYSITGEPMKDNYGRVLADLYVHKRNPDGSIDNTKLYDYRTLMVDKGLAVDLDNPNSVDKLNVAPYIKRQMKAKAITTNKLQYEQEFNKDNLTNKVEILARNIELGLNKFKEKGLDENSINVLKSNKLKYIKDSIKYTKEQIESDFLSKEANHDYLDALTLLAQNGVDVSRSLIQNRNKALNEVRKKYLDGNKIKDIVDGKPLTMKEKVYIEKTLNYFAKNKKDKVYADYNTPFTLDLTNQANLNSEDYKDVKDLLNKNIASINFTEGHWLNQLTDDYGTKEKNFYNLATRVESAIDKVGVKDKNIVKTAFKILNNSNDDVFNIKIKDENGKNKTQTFDGDTLFEEISKNPKILVQLGLANKDDNNQQLLNKALQLQKVVYAINDVVSNPYKDEATASQYVKRVADSALNTISEISAGIVGLAKKTYYETGKLGFSPEDRNATKALKEYHKTIEPVIESIKQKEKQELTDIDAKTIKDIELFSRANGKSFFDSPNMDYKDVGQEVLDIFGALATSANLTSEKYREESYIRHIATNVRNGGLSYYGTQLGLGALEFGLALKATDSVVKATAIDYGRQFISGNFISEDKKKQQFTEGTIQTLDESDPTLAITSGLLDATIGSAFALTLGKSAKIDSDTGNIKLDTTGFIKSDTINEDINAKVLPEGFSQVKNKIINSDNPEVKKELFNYIKDVKKFYQDKELSNEDRSKLIMESTNKLIKTSLDNNIFDENDLYKGIAEKTVENIDNELKNFNQIKNGNEPISDSTTKKSIYVSKDLDLSGFKFSAKQFKEAKTKSDISEATDTFRAELDDSSLSKEDKEEIARKVSDLLSSTTDLGSEKRLNLSNEFIVDENYNNGNLIKTKTEREINSEPTSDYVNKKVDLRHIFDEDNYDSLINKIKSNAYEKAQKRENIIDSKLQALEDLGIQKKVFVNDDGIHIEEYHFPNMTKDEAQKFVQEHFKDLIQRGDEGFIGSRSSLLSVKIDKNGSHYITRFKNIHDKDYDLVSDQIQGYLIGHVNNDPVLGLASILSNKEAYNLLNEKDAIGSLINGDFKFATETKYDKNGIKQKEGNILFKLGDEYLTPYEILKKAKNGNKEKANEHIRNMFGMRKILKDSKDDTIELYNKVKQNLSETEFDKIIKNQQNIEKEHYELRRKDFVKDEPISFDDENVIRTIMDKLGYEEGKKKDYQINKYNGKARISKYSNVSKELNYEYGFDRPMNIVEFIKEKFNINESRDAIKKVYDIYYDKDDIKYKQEPEPILAQRELEKEIKEKNTETTDELRKKSKFEHNWTIAKDDIEETRTRGLKKFIEKRGIDTKLGLSFFNNSKTEVFVRKAKPTFVHNEYVFIKQPKYSFNKDGKLVENGYARRVSNSYNKEGKIEPSRKTNFIDKKGEGISFYKNFEDGEAEYVLIAENVNDALAYIELNKEAFDDVNTVIIDNYGLRHNFYDNIAKINEIMRLAHNENKTAQIIHIRDKADKPNVFEYYNMLENNIKEFDNTFEIKEPSIGKDLNEDLIIHKENIRKQQEQIKLENAKSILHNKISKGIKTKENESIVKNFANDILNLLEDPNEIDKLFVKRNKAKKSYFWSRNGGQIRLSKDYKDIEVVHETLHALTEATDKNGKNIMFGSKEGQKLLNDINILINNLPENEYKIIEPLLENKNFEREVIVNALHDKEVFDILNKYKIENEKLIEVNEPSEIANKSLAQRIITYLKNFFNNLKKESIAEDIVKQLDKQLNMIKTEKALKYNANSDIKLFSTFREYAENKIKELGETETVELASRYYRKVVDFISDIDYKYTDNFIMNQAKRIFKGDKINDHILNYKQTIEHFKSKNDVMANALFDNINEITSKMSQNEKKLIKALLYTDLQVLKGNELKEVLNILKTGNKEKLTELANRNSELLKELLNDDYASNSIENIFKFITERESNDIYAKNAYDLIDAMLLDAATNAEKHLLAQQIDKELTYQILDGMFDSISKKYSKELGSINIDDVYNVISYYQNALDDVPVVGRKGEFIFDKFTENEYKVLNKDEYLNNKEKYKKWNVVEDGNKIWLYRKKNTLGTLKGILEPNVMKNIDPKVEITKKMYEIISSLKTKDSIDEFVKQNFGSEYYAEFDRNDKFKAIRIIMPPKVLDKIEFIEPIDILVSNARKQREHFVNKTLTSKFLNETNIIPKDFKDMADELSYLDKLEKSLYNDTDDMSLAFIDDSKFNSDRFLEIENSDLFKSKYVKLSQQDKNLLPIQFQNAKYIRKEFKDYLVTTYNDFGLHIDNNFIKFILNAAKDATSLFKRAVVTMRPKAYINNYLFNQNLLYIATGKFGGKSIFKNAKKIHEYFELDYKLHKAKIKGDKQLINKLQKEIDNHPMKQYDDLGFFTSVVDGVDFTETTQSNMLYRGVEKVAKRFKLNRNKKINKIVSNIFSADGSKVYKYTSRATKIGDFVFRIELYNNLIKKGVNKKEAKFKALDYFVNPSKVAPKPIVALDTYGIIPFAQWNYKMLPVIVELAKENPQRAVGSFVFWGMLLDSADGRKGTYLKDTSIEPMHLPFELLNTDFGFKPKIPTIFDII